MKDKPLKMKNIFLRKILTHMSVPQLREQSIITHKLRNMIIQLITTHGNEWKLNIFTFTTDL